MLQLVREAGGVDAATAKRKWPEFAAALGFARASDAATLKERYIKWIEPFEQHWLKVGKSLVDVI